MKTIAFITIIFILLIIIGCSTKNTIGEKMKLTSSVFQNDKEIPSKYTCDGINLSPPLEITDVPKEAKSLVLIMDDPDAIKPANKVWDHWIIFNIPATTNKIEEGKEPLGIHGKGNSNNLKYIGPCPPDARHRYYFKLYALDSNLSLPEGVNKQQVEEAMKGHILAQTTLIGTYIRK